MPSIGRKRFLEEGQEFKHAFLVCFFNLLISDVYWVRKSCFCGKKYGIDRYSNYLGDWWVEQFEVLLYNFKKPFWACMHKDYIFVFMIKYVKQNINVLICRKKIKRLLHWIWLQKLFCFQHCWITALQLIHGRCLLRKASRFMHAWILVGCYKQM